MAGFDKKSKRAKFLAALEHFRIPERTSVMRSQEHRWRLYSGSANPTKHLKMESVVRHSVSQEHGYASSDPDAMVDDDLVNGEQSAIHLSSEAQTWAEQYAAAVISAPEHTKAELDAQKEACDLGSVLSQREVDSLRKRHLSELKGHYQEEIKRLGEILVMKRKAYNLQQDMYERGTRTFVDPIIASRLEQSLGIPNGLDLEEYDPPSATRNRMVAALYVRKLRTLESNVTRESAQYHSAQTPHFECVAQSCRNICLPFARFCVKHIVDDDKQQLYTKTASGEVVVKEDTTNLFGSNVSLDDFASNPRLCVRLPGEPQMSRSAIIRNGILGVGLDEDFEAIVSGSLPPREENHRDSLSSVADIRTELLHDIEPKRRAQQEHRHGDVKDEQQPAPRTHAEHQAAPVATGTQEKKP